MKLPIACGRLACAGGMLALLTAGVHAQSVQDFYKGKQLTLLAPSTTGGNGIYARTLAQYMKNHIPGHPTIVVQAMPAAAGLVIMNHLYSVAAKDGLTFGTVDRGMLVEPLLDNASATYDASKMTAIASIGKQVVVCSVSTRSKIKTLQQAMQQEVLVGAQAPNDALSLYPTLLNAVLHTKFKVVAGYDGTQSIWLAIERGELDGVCGAWSTLKSDRPDWISQKKITPLLQVSFTGTPDLPNVPKLSDFVMDETARETLAFYASADVVGRPYLAPPGIPDDRAAALRRAFDATMKDAEFREAARKINLDIDPVDGEAMQAALKSIYATPRDVMQRIIDIRRAAGEKK